MGVGRDGMGWEGWAEVMGCWSWVEQRKGRIGTVKNGIVELARRTELLSIRNFISKPVAAFAMLWEVLGRSGQMFDPWSIDGSTSGSPAIIRHGVDDKASPGLKWEGEEDAMREAPFYKIHGCECLYVMASRPAAKAPRPKGVDRAKSHDKAS